MKRVWQGMVAVLAAGAMMLYLSGCASTQGKLAGEKVKTPDYQGAYGGYAPYQGEATPQPVKAKPAPKPSGVCPAGYDGGSIINDFVQLTKCVPTAATLGQEFTVLLDVKALAPVMNVTVTDLIPDGAKFVKSEPAGQVNGNVLVWNVGKLANGESKSAKVTLLAEKEGTLTNCAYVTAVPVTCATTVVGQPKLAIEKTGPAAAQLGDQISYKIVVKNVGSAVAKDVVIVDQLPEGLDHASGQKALQTPVGDLAPAASKEVVLPVKATKRGKLCNVATAKGSNVSEVKAEACTVVTQKMLTIAKTGTAEQYIGKNADYQIVVANPGDASVMNVTVTDTAPAGTRIVSAAGAVIAGNVATWKIAELKGGDKQTFNLTLTSATIGKLCNTASAASTDGLSANSEACTLWKGVAGILLEKLDTKDPILVGDATDLVAAVTNQGEADLSNVVMVIKFPKELTPVAASGATAGKIEGQTVTFAAFPKLAPKQKIEFRVNTKGAAAGDARTQFSLKADLLETPVEAWESTHVY